MLFRAHYRHFDPSVFKNCAYREDEPAGAGRVFAAPSRRFGQPGTAFPSTTFGVVSSTRTNNTPRQVQGSLLSLSRPVDRRWNFRLNYTGCPNARGGSDRQVSGPAWGVWSKGSNYEENRVVIRRCL